MKRYAVDIKASKSYINEKHLYYLTISLGRFDISLKLQQSAVESIIAAWMGAGLGTTTAELYPLNPLRFLKTNEAVQDPEFAGAIKIDEKTLGIRSFD